MKNSQKNAQAQHSYTHITVKHPRTELLLTQGHSYLNHKQCTGSYTWHTSSVQGLMHDTQAAYACKISTHWGNIQASLIYTSVWHSVCLPITHTHINSNNTTHTHTQIHITCLMVMHTLTHRHTCITMEVSGLLLSYTCALSSNAFCFILLPESSFSVQNTHDPKKKSKTRWSEDLT